MLIEQLSQWGVIEVTGDEAPNFLQSQLTQDVAGMSPGRVVLAGYCTAKGRMLGQFLVVRDGARYLMLTHAALADGLVRRLSMFVLRLKCKLRNATPEWRVMGLTGSPDASALAAAGISLPDISAFKQLEPFAREALSADATSHLIGWPAADTALRHLLLVAAGSVSDAGFAAPAGAASAWAADDIRCGIPFLVPENVEAFVPQMVNLDVIGGVSFSKGCYPGQEIVARSHYLGKQKRRMQIGKTSAALVEGADVYSSAHPGEPAGRVVNAAVLSDSETLILFEISSDDLQGASLHAGAADGPSVTLMPLPYALPAPLTPPGRG